MLNLCEKEEGKDASTQTEEVVGIVHVPVVHHLHKECMSVAVQTMPTKCCCQDLVLANQEEIKSLLMTVISNSSHSQQQVFTDFSDTDMCALLVSPVQQSEPVEASQTIATNEQFAVVETVEVKVEKNTLSLSDSPQIFEEIFRRSSSMTNYAKNLVFDMFRRDELLGANCAGVKGKRGLEIDPRLTKIKECIFKKYSVVDKREAWKLCRKAIDSALRKLY